MNTQFLETVKITLTSTDSLLTEFLFDMSSSILSGMFNVFERKASLHFSLNSLFLKTYTKDLVTGLSHNFTSYSDFLFKWFYQCSWEVAPIF